VAEDDESRTSFLKGCLSKLGLTVSQETSSVPSLSRLHLSSINHIEVSELLEELKDVITVEDGEEYIKGENDTFHIEKHSSRWSLNSLVKSLPVLGAGMTGDQSKTDQTDGVTEDRILDYSKIIKRLIPHETEWPGGKETPYFNHHAFFANLRRYQQENSSEAEEFGNVLMYGEVVTSTNTILEKYIKISLCEIRLTCYPETLNSSLVFQMASQLLPPSR
jgi:biotin--protein ligase